MTLDDTKAASVMATADRTVDPEDPGQDARSLNQTSTSTYTIR